VEKKKLFRSQNCNDVVRNVLLNHEMIGFKMIMKQ